MRPSIKIFLVVFLFLSFTNSFTQDLEPRFLSSMPVSTNFSGIFYGYSSGDILLNAQEIEDLNAKINTVGVLYGRSFNLFNKLTKFDVVAPYTFGNLNALVSNVDSTVYKKGFNDPSFRISMIIIGEEAHYLKDFPTRTKKRFKFGAAFKIKPPLGTYDETKLINYGANRWGFQIKAAASYAVTKKLILEWHVDSWVFTENNSFNNGNSLQQKPLFNSQLHIAYVFSPKLWSSVSLGQVAFGETSINGIGQDNNQKNSRYGATISYKIGKKSSLKFALTNGLYTGTGADFTSAVLAYSILWFDKPKD